MRELMYELYCLLDFQKRLREQARRSSELFSARYGELDEQINALDEQIKWARFAVYCNTPCWRYSCEE